MLLNQTRRHEDKSLHLYASALNTAVAQKEKKKKSVPLNV